MKLHVSKLIDLHFNDIAYLIFADGEHDKPFARMNALEFKMFLDECVQAQNKPVSK